MTKAKKWNVKTKKYEDYELPEGVIIYTNNMDDITTCSSCGRKVVFGCCLTSRTIHNIKGFGFPVCEKCYMKEIREEFENE